MPTTVRYMSEQYSATLGATYDMTGVEQQERVWPRR